MVERKILFLDDEPEWHGGFVETLGESFKQVIVKHTIDDAIDYFDSFQDVEGIFLDVMMPGPIGLSPNLTNQGFETGIYFIERMREYILAHTCPVVIVTNRQKELFHGRLDAVKLPTSYCTVKQKGEMTGQALCKMMIQMIDSLRK